MRNSFIMNNFSYTNDSNNSTFSAVTEYWTTEYILLAIYLGTLSIVGITGNIPVLIVYFNRKENTASNTFIKSLAVLDLLVCSLMMPYTMIYELHLVKSDMICRAFEFLRHFTIFASGSTLVAIAIERYIAVCRITHKMSIKNVQYGMFSIFVLSCLVAGPSIGIFAVVSQKEVADVKCRFPHETIDGKFCHFTYSVTGKLYALIYQGVLIVLFFVSLMLIFVVYIIIYFVLWKRTKFRKRALSRTPREISVNSDIHSSCEQHPIQKRENNDIETSRIYVFDNEDSDAITAFNNNSNKNTKLRKREKVRKVYHQRTAKMLFMCSVIFLLTWLPFWIDIFGITNSLVFRYLFFIGNATNPIVYGIINEQIRTEFYKLLARCCLHTIFRLKQRPSLST